MSSRRLLVAGQIKSVQQKYCWFDNLFDSAGVVLRKLHWTKSCIKRELDWNKVELQIELRRLIKPTIDLISIGLSD